MLSEKIEPEFEIVALEAGMKTLRSIAHHETFHPVIGPAAEAKILHFDQQRIVERCQKHLALKRRFVIWDIGLGAAANALAAVDALGQNPTEVELHSFDKTTAPLEFALARSRELGYLHSRHELIVELLSRRQVQVNPSFSWKLHLGDFSRYLQTSDTSIPAPNAIFYDPYSPPTNPEMWTLEHFRALFERLDPSEECTMSSYTRSTSMRVTFALAGFYVGVGCVIGWKAETTLTSNRLELLPQPLERRWLERVRTSTNSAPLTAANYVKSPIGDADFTNLSRLPQFTSSRC
jgi:hypothetical protein